MEKGKGQDEEPEENREKAAQIAQLYRTIWDAEGKKNWEMLVMGVSLKHTDQGRRVERKSGRAENI